MNMQEFLEFVKKRKIPANAYALDGLRSNFKHGGIYDDIQILEKKRIGWVVFYFEKGQKSIYRFHLTCSSALSDLSERLAKDFHE